MASPLFADISSYQTVSNWSDYYYWSRSGDGLTRVLMKATEGVGFKDSKFENCWFTAVSNGVWATHAYHYARPDLNPGAAGAANEARWFASVINVVSLSSQDILMLDFEQNESAAWAHAFYDALANAITLHSKPVLYDSVSHFNQFFAGDLALAAKYDCALASWHPIGQGPPPVPPGWRMLWWQYTDRENVPGIGICDANLWLGEAREEQAGMLLQHPLIIGQQDVVFLGQDGHVHLTGNHNDGMAGLVKDSADTDIDLGAPSEQLIKVEGAYSNNGQSINLLATGASGQVYGTAINPNGGALEMPWTPLAGVKVFVPTAGAAGEPLAEKIIAAIAGVH